MPIISLQVPFSYDKGIVCLGVGRFLRELEEVPETVHLLFATNGKLAIEVQDVFLFKFDFLNSMWCVL